MKQVLILEHTDLDRLKAGETIQLTAQLMLSMEGRKTRVRHNKDTVVAEQDDDKQLTPKQRYNRVYQRRRREEKA